MRHERQSGIVTERSLLLDAATEVPPPRSDQSEPQDKRSLTQTPVSEIKFDYSTPPDMFGDHLSLVRNPSHNPTFEQKVGNPAHGAFIKNENGEWLWESTKDVYVQYGLDGLDEYFADEEGNVDIETQNTLNEIRELVSEKKNIKSIINSAAKKAGISSGDLGKLKIEVDSSGKVLVGGLDDTALTEKLQNALNEESGFGLRLKEYQNSEEKLYSDVVHKKIFAAGGQSPGSTANSEIDVVGMDLLEQMVKEEGIDNLDGLGPNVLAYAAAELFRDTTVSADFSHKDKGLENPGATVHKELDRVEWAIEKELENINLSNRMAALNKDQAVADVVSMDNIKITLNENGEIKIEGKFSSSGAADSEARARVGQILQEEFAGQTANGGESNLTTALRQLRLDHDEEFGESTYAKTGSVTFDGKTSETFVDSPEAQMAIQKEMADAVTQAVKNETGVELEDGALAVTEEGKVVLKKIPPALDDAQNVRDFIDSLNREMGKESSILTKEDFLNEEDDGLAAKKTADTLKKLLEELDSYEQRTVRYFYR